MEKTMKYNLLVLTFLVPQLCFAIAPHVKLPFKTKAPKTNYVYPIAVIGGGTAGVAAANRAVLNNDEVLLFTGNKKSLTNARGSWVRTVDNVPGLSDYERTVLDLRNKTLANIQTLPLAHNLNVVEDQVMTITKESKFFLLKDNSGHEYKAQHIILATGIMDTQPHIKGSIKYILPYANKQQVAYCIKCDGHRAYGKRVAILGHNKSSAAIAQILHERYQLPQIIILTNGREPEWTPKQREMMANYKIESNYEPIQRVLGRGKKLEGFSLQDGTQIKIDMAYVSLGIRPNNQLAIQLGATLDKRGLVQADDSGESSVAGLYVVGDLRSERPKQIYTAIADATTSADMINRKLRSAKEVTPCDLKDWKPCLEENSSTMKKNICTRMNDFARRTKKTISTFITRCFKSS